MLLLLICLNTFALTSFAYESEVDSLLKEISSNPNDSLLLETFLDEIYKTVYNDTETALHYSKEGLKIAQQENNYKMIARLNMQIGISYDLKGMYDSAFIKYEEGLAIAEVNNYTEIKGDLYNNYSITLAVIGKFDESINYAIKALDIYEKSGDSARIAKIYNNLGSRYSDMKQSEKALEYYLLAAEINKDRGDDYRLAHNYGNIGLLYYDLLKDYEALSYFKMSIALQDTLANKMDFSIALHNLALAYNRLGMYDEALYHENKALRLSTELDDDLGIISSLNGLAAIYDNQGFSDKALQYLNQSEEIANKLGARYYLIKIYEKKASLFARTNSFEQAFIYNQKYSTLKDSILTIEKDKALSKIDQYENEKQEKEIELLTLDAEVQKLNIKRQKIIRNSISAVGLLILILAIGIFHRYRYVRKTRNELSIKNKQIHDEKERSDELLLNILPAETAEELKNKGSSRARHFDKVTVMFTDFKGFTSMAEQLSPQELVDEIDYCFKHFDEIISKHNIEKIKTIGDAYMCAGGLPVVNDTNPVDVVRAALEIQLFMNQLKAKKQSEEKPFFELRIGIHTGPVIAGIVGIKKFQYDIWGDTVNIAARMESSCEVDRVNISQTTYENIKDQYECYHRGKIEAKGKGEIDMYFVKNKKDNASA